MAENTLNEEVTKAIYDAVRNNGQPIEAAKRLEAWMSQVANGNVSLNEADEYKSHLETMLSALQVDEELFRNNN